MCLKEQTGDMVFIKNPKRKAAEVTQRSLLSGGLEFCPQCSLISSQLSVIPDPEDPTPSSDSVSTVCIWYVYNACRHNTCTQSK